MIKTAVVLVVTSIGLYATGTSTCADPGSSGCNPWWMSYSTSVAGDGSFGRSTGVSPIYTANYTNVAASQDSLSATFSWASDASTRSSSAWTVNNTWSSSDDFAPISSGYIPPATQSSTPTYNSYSNNVSSYIPSNSGSSVSPELTASSNSFFDFWYRVYMQSYGTTSSIPTIQNSGVMASAELANPEPGTWVGIGLGLVLLAAKARRMRKR